MNRFLKLFYHPFSTHKLIDEINEYAANNNLQIISFTNNENQHAAIVLFEREKSD